MSMLDVQGLTSRMGGLAAVCNKIEGKIS
uniref:Uncharacterized protein n=1 Tax=Arundo donax TaxID=35708 RepID=A0A0A9HEJ2_ARUDO